MTDCGDEKQPGEKPPEPQNAPAKKNEKRPTPLHPHIDEKKGEN